MRAPFSSQGKPIHYSIPCCSEHVRSYPNVGKSSFVNKMTNANVEVRIAFSCYTFCNLRGLGLQVEPYAFTTKSLYIGHMDYRYSRWQVTHTTPSTAQSS